MAQHQDRHVHGMQETRAIMNLPTTMAATSSDEEVLADVDEPPDLKSARPSFGSRTLTTSFTKTTPPPNQRKESLLTSALTSAQSPTHTEEHSEPPLSRGLSCASTWSDRSTASTAELTSDGGCTSPTRTSTPSPTLPPSSFHRMGPVFKSKTFEQPVSIVSHDEEHIGPLQKQPNPTLSENAVEANLGRKRCITFACGRKDTPKVQPVPNPVQNSAQPPKRTSTIKFACPSKISTAPPLVSPKPRRHLSPAPMPRRLRDSPKPSSPKSHRDSDSTVRNESPKSFRKSSSVSRQRKLSVNSDLAKSEAFRFHEFASSEDDEDEWTQEATCHRNRLTVGDTLKIENTLRKLGEEVEEEVLEDEEEDDLDDEDADNDDDEEEETNDNSESDEGFHSDDEKGYGSGEESDTGSDYRWWTPGQSTAATSYDHIEHIRPVARRSSSGSSISSMESAALAGLKATPAKMPKRRKSSHPLVIRAPSPELPDSTDFVCGTLDEDRPLEDAYMSCLERRRAAKHKACPQDIDPTFPQSDPEMEEEDEDDEPENAEDESDQHLMMHGQMDAEEENELRGRGKAGLKKRSPAQSPKRLRSPPPLKRCRSPPPRRLFGHSPKRLRSPPAPRLRSPPPTRRTSSITSPNRMEVRFAGLAERPPITESSSLPRTPAALSSPQLYDDDDENTNEFPNRGAIDIKLGLERKRLRRREKLYQKLHRKTIKEKEKRPVPGKGAERMREMGMGLAAHKGRKNSFPARPQADGDVHMLSV